jgi:hypothetical protein
LAKSIKNSETAAKRHGNSVPENQRTVPFNQRPAPITDGFVGVMRGLYREGEKRSKGKVGMFELFRLGIRVAALNACVRKNNGISNKTNRNVDGKEWPHERDMLTILGIESALRGQTNSSVNQAVLFRSSLYCWAIKISDGEYRATTRK